MDNKLIEEIYETADRYSGRMTELLLITIATIQRLEAKVKIESNNASVIESISKLLEHDNSDKSSEIKDIINK